jgi:hypothetical protein
MTGWVEQGHQIVTGVYQVSVPVAGQAEDQVAGPVADQAEDRAAD